MHRVGVAALALSLVAGLGGVAAASAADGHHVYPSRQQVNHARHQVALAADDVAGVRAQLAAADARMRDAAVRAEQAAERYNGARWHLQQARRDARVAEQHARIATADAAHTRHSYAATVVSSYELGPSLSPLSALTGSAGISTVVRRMATLQNAQSAMDHTYDAYRASSTLAGVASAQADAARARAQTLATRARQARDRAAAAATAAQQTTQAIAARKTQLIHRLATLQHVSVALAEQRQAGIEKAAAEAAQRAAERAARRAAAQRAAQQAAQQAAARQAAQRAARKAAAQQAAQHASQAPSAHPTHAPPPPPPPPTNPAPPPPVNPPPPASGAQAAIAFARAQIGDPYVWGAAGPNAWDCSGLTMAAWRAGGIYLPHFAAAQYEESTRISPTALQPGDLVFWGSSSSPSSIYHVAIYVGNGMIIQAPRTGVPVQEVSMYSWITPNFYARP